MYIIYVSLFVHVILIIEWVTKYPKLKSYYVYIAPDRSENDPDRIQPVYTAPDCNDAHHLTPRWGPLLMTCKTGHFKTHFKPKNTFESEAKLIRFCSVNVLIRIKFWYKYILCEHVACIWFFAEKSEIRVNRKGDFVVVCQCNTHFFKNLIYKYHEAQIAEKLRNKLIS